MKKLIAVLMFCSIAASAAKKPEVKSADAFYVYSDKGAKGSHYIPSGWMGDYGDLKLNDGYTTDCIDGRTCIEIKYSAKGTQGAGWAGIFWQHPANNWGDKPGGFDLTGNKRLTFWAKGAKGGEAINEFKVGGIAGEQGDSDSETIGPIVLENTWKKYTIELANKDLKHIIGGFCYSTSRDNNPEGFTIYLDEIRFEK